MMGIHLRWEHWPDCAVFGELRDEHSLVNRFLADFRVRDFRYLRFISHKSHTIFHLQHIPQLIQELEALSAQHHEPAVTEHLRAVLQLVHQANGRVDTYIRFYAS